MRRVFIVCTAVCVVAMLSAFGMQNEALPITIDAAPILSRVIYGTMSLAGASMLWLAKKGLDSLNRVEERVNHSSQQLATISHELFGATGTNGMRSDMRETKRLVQRHSKVLVVLADREGIDFHEDSL